MKKETTEVATDLATTLPDLSADWPDPCKNTPYAKPRRLIRSVILSGALEGAVAEAHKYIDYSQGPDWIRAQQDAFADVYAEIYSLLDPKR